MTRDQMFAALAVGRDAVAALQPADCPVFIGGEMGIGNTTAAAALACALLKAPVELLVGPGTGLDAKGVTHKAKVIERALKHHNLSADDPLLCLQSVGGLEIAALCGAYLHCAQRGIPVLVDGFICAVAALTALRLQPAAKDWLLFAHQSAEPGFQVLMQALDVRPLLQLGMRLGEGSGAAVALSLLRHACALHNGMATFAEAAVSGASNAHEG